MAPIAGVSTSGSSVVSVSRVSANFPLPRQRTGAIYRQPLFSKHDGSAVGIAAAAQ